TRVAGDSTQAADMTRAELSVRREVWELLRYLRAHVPEFQDAYMQQTSPQVGPRESRQIVGPYRLTGEDIVAGRKFDDAVARGSWWVDIHCPLGHTYPVHLCVASCPKGEECPFWVAEFSGKREPMRRDRESLYPPQGDWYDIPYRCLLSVGVPNLLASGRCISATHEG
ncbi:MAG: FAD-dependent oxidoreductase, partial [Chloroflexi bacterium]|nr:FAD-dependent oxidoreductase [Chloroflexota bacterium]